MSRTKIYKCPHCGESMKHLCADIYTCEECGVIKSEIYLIDSSEDKDTSLASDSVRACPKCGGSGRVEDVCNHLAFTKECEFCDGVGEIPIESDTKRTVE